MARISRKGATRHNAADTPKHRIWNCAVYARLSLEDSGRKDTGTIEAQIELVASYVNKRPDLCLFDTYIDNGASGKDFDRPGWLRLMDDIRAGRVDCIAVKDLSRFSRNYIETCEFLEKILPFMGVRFVSINDGYDSAVSGNHNEGLLIALKALVHDRHIKDISRKIHASIRTRRERGEYTRGYAPYGYRKMQGQKGKLEPDPKTAPIVRQIFEWRASGIGNQTICRMLDDQGAPTPNEYIRRKTGAFTSDHFKSTIWRPRTLKNILGNVAYIGSLRQGTQIQRLYANEPKSVCIPRDRWIITENSHRPIVRRELFDAVQAMESDAKARSAKCHKKRTDNILRGYTVCGICGSKMSRSHSSKRAKNGQLWETYYFLCPLNRQHSLSGDTSARKFKSIREDVLLNAVSVLIFSELRKASGLGAIIEKQAKRQANPRAVWDKEIARATGELNTINQRIGKLYEDYVDKLLDEWEYTAIKSKYEVRADALCRDIGNLADRAASAPAENNQWLAAAQSFQSPEKLTRAMVEAIVSRINIYSSNRLEVVWKFGDV